MAYVSKEMQKEYIQKLPLKDYYYILDLILINV